MSEIIIMKNIKNYGLQVAQKVKHSVTYCEKTTLLYCTKLCRYINFYICYVTKKVLNIIKKCGLQVAHNVKHSFTYCEKTGL